MDLWVVNIALPVLQHGFAPATLSDVSWILDVYAIVIAALLLPLDFLTYAAGVSQARRMALISAGVGWPG